MSHLPLGYPGTIDGGWPHWATTNADALRLFGSGGLQFLLPRGFALLGLAVRPTPQPRQATLHWLLEPSGGYDLDDCIFYIDGSAYHAEHPELAWTGFGIVAAAWDGSLVAVANGTPPRWARTSAAAELWALATTLVKVYYLDALGAGAQTPHGRPKCLH